jgi:chorismate mutase
MPHPDSLVRADGAAEMRSGLQALRSEINRIDEDLLELMEQRLACSLAIAEHKEDAPTAFLYLRPEREQDVLERIADRAERMPKDAIGIIWRELMALGLQAQKKTELVLHAADQPVLVTSTTRVRFGCAAPILVAGSPGEALERARSREAVAVIELSPLSGWWVDLFDDQSLAIFDSLPDDHGRVAALAIGRVSANSLPKGVTFPIIGEGSLRRRVSEGESIRPLALCGRLRLCISHGQAPLQGAER